MKITITMRVRISTERSERKRDAALVAPSARWLTTAIAGLLFLPVVLIGIQNKVNLEAFHNRLLRPWPAVDLFQKSPVEYFGAAKGWLADRVFPIVGVSQLTKATLLDVLGSPPQRRVTMGRDGYIFLNGSSDADVYGIFDSVCVRAHESAMSRKVAAALTSLAAYSQARGVKVDVVVVPTMASLYAENLPDSVPTKYRTACGERAKGNSPLIEVASQSDGRMTYPLREMNAARGDAAFFPKANWHANGLSLKVARDAYLGRRALALPTSERLELTSGQSEILSTYRIARNFPVYRILDDSLAEKPAEAEALANLTRDLFSVPRVVTHAYESTTAPNRETVLMLSDSYGDFASGVFGGAFGKLLHVTTNDMAERNAPMLVDRVAKVQKLDRIILLVMEGNLERVINWAQAFSSTFSESAFDAPVTESVPKIDSSSAVSCEGSVDSLNGTSPVPLELGVHGPIEMHGWSAISTKDGVLSDNVFIQLTDKAGRHAIFKTHANPRPDLAKHFDNPRLADAGFAARIDTTKMKGLYLAGVVRKTADGYHLCSPIRTLTIEK